MIINLNREIAQPRTIQAFAETNNLKRKTEFHLTAADWGIQLPLDQNKIRANLILEPEFYLVKKGYKTQMPYISEDHTRLAIIQSVKNEYLEKYYNQNTEHRRFLHVTLYVGVLEDVKDTNWKHGIGLKSLNDSGLIVQKIDNQLAN